MSLKAILNAVAVPPHLLGGEAADPMLGDSDEATRTRNAIAAWDAGIFDVTDPRTGHVVITRPLHPIREIVGRAQP